MYKHGLTRSQSSAISTTRAGIMGCSSKQGLETGAASNIPLYIYLSPFGRALSLGIHEYAMECYGVVLEENVDWSFFVESFDTKPSSLFAHNYNIIFTMMTSSSIPPSYNNFHSAYLI